MTFLQVWKRHNDAVSTINSAILPPFVFVSTFPSFTPPAKKEGRKEGRKDRERGVEKYVIM
jgi:hypothetical protein